MSDGFRDRGRKPSMPGSRNISGGKQLFGEEANQYFVPQWQSNYGYQWNKDRFPLEPLTIFKGRIPEYPK